VWLNEVRRHSQTFFFKVDILTGLLALKGEEPATKLCSRLFYALTNRVQPNVLTSGTDNHDSKQKNT
jgi:hypothetical protein